jgi:hypothetical protein
MKVYQYILTILMVLVACLLLIPLSTALVKEVVYKQGEEYPSYRVWNNDQTTLLAELKLIHNTKQCSDNCEAVILLDLKTSWTLPSSPNNQFQFNFWDKARTYLKNNNIQNVKLQVSATNETVFDSVGVIHSVPKYVNTPWGNTINAGVKYIRITGSKAPEDEVEWIPDFMGLNLYEWATWENAYVQLDNYTLWLNNVQVFGDTPTNTGFTINTSSIYVLGASSNYQHGALLNFSVPLNTSGGKWVNISFRNTQTHARYTHVVLMNKSKYGPSWCRTSYNPVTNNIAIYHANPSEADGGGNCGVGSGELDGSSGIGTTENNILYNMNFNGSRLEVYREGSLLLEYNEYDSSKLGDMVALYVWSQAYDSGVQTINNLTVTIESDETPAPAYGNFSIDSTLLSPATSYVTNQTDITFTANINPLGLNVSNVTFYYGTGGVGTGVFTSFGTNTTASTTNYSINISRSQVFGEGNYHWNVYACGNNGTTTNCSWATTNRTFTVDSTKPVVHVNGPSGNQGTFGAGKTLNLTYSINDTNNQSCWFNYDGVDKTIDCNANLFIFNATTATALTLYANDTAGNLNSNTTSWFYPVVEGDTYYLTNVTESENATFSLFMNWSESFYISATAELVYNGTTYTSSTLGNGGNANFTVIFDIPLIETHTVNRTFYWKVSFYNGTGTYTLLTSPKSHIVNRMYLETCNATYTTKAFNFTVYNENNLSRINNFDFNANFYYWKGSGSVFRNTTFSNANIAEKALCYLPRTDSLYTNALITYGQTTNETYLPRNYYFNNYYFDNVTDNVSLYLLPITDATTFILKVQDSNVFPLAGYYIYVQRYYPGTDSYETVQVGKTDDNGKTLGFYKTETVFYRHIITDENGTVVLTTSRQLIFGETVPYTLIFTIGSVSDYPWINLKEKDGLTYGLTYNKTSQQTIFIYADTDTGFEQGRLEVYQNNPSGSDTLICNTTSLLASALLNCDLSGESNKTSYTAKAYITRDGDEDLIALIKFDKTTSEDVFGTEGLLIAFFIVLTSGLIFFWSPVMGVWGMTISMVFIKMIGLANFSYIWVFSAIFIAIIMTVLFKREGGGYYG